MSAVMSDILSCDALKAERASQLFRAQRAGATLEIILMHAGLSEIGLARASRELDVIRDAVDAAVAMEGDL